MWALSSMANAPQARLWGPFGFRVLGISPEIMVAEHTPEKQSVFARFQATSWLGSKIMFRAAGQSLSGLKCPAARCRSSFHW